VYISKEPTPCWQRDANDMRKHDPNLWFSKVGAKRSERAKELCLTQCKERIECLAAVLKWEQEHGIQPGVWGGLDEHQRRQLPGHKPRSVAA
jgi:hypothetical protein